MTDPAQLPLRDIHLPPGISWWPPAPGWWILAGLLLAAVLGVWFWLRRLKKIRASAAFAAVAALQELREAYRRHGDPLLLVREISVLLRRMSISKAGREETAGLTGEAWLQHLDSVLPEQSFSGGPGRILIDAPYRPAISQAEMEPLLRLCEQWINAQAAQGGGGG